MLETRIERDGVVALCHGVPAKQWRADEVAVLVFPVVDDQVVIMSIHWAKGKYTVAFVKTQIAVTVSVA